MLASHLSHEHETADIPVLFYIGHKATMNTLELEGICAKSGARGLIRYQDMHELMKKIKTYLTKLSFPGEQFPSTL